jgi:hypothetical protein
MEDIPQEIQGDLRDRIRADLLRVHSKRLERADLKTCLRESYDVYARLLRDAGWPLTEILLTESIPAWVYQWGVAKKWFPCPSGHFVDGRGSLFEGRALQYVPIPEAERKVPNRYKAFVRNAVAGRVSYWQAEASFPEVGPLPKSIPDEGTTIAECSGDGAEPKATAKGARRGPKPDYENPPFVAEIVARVAPDGDLHAHLNAICEALDNAEIPFPKTWPRRESHLKSWQDGALLEPPVAKRAIKDRLKVAKQLKNNPPEILP